MKNMTDSFERDKTQFTLEGTGWSRGVWIKLLTFSLFGEQKLYESTSFDEAESNTAYQPSKYST